MTAPATGLRVRHRARRHPAHPRAGLIPSLSIEVRPTPPPAPVGRARIAFPDPREADAEGFVAHGGDLEPATVIAAYRRGIFPWPFDGHELFWWSPDPRAVIPIDGLRVSRRLARTLRRGACAVTINAAFEEVVAGCAAREETWITPGIRGAYGRLHALGWAHSVEVWRDGALAGGLYGLALGGLFAAESMFHRVTDASKIAMVALVQHARRVGVTLIDAQVPSAHIMAMGAVTMPRAEYLARLAEAVNRPVRFAG
ncbi:MAG TPA: leucyl/phenylalanyl-tRNA--protein transferase [Candidatus Limnocylindria bacterium]|nr:leucyl/phenylalanyl-tRNA--protein transferase [Candidatus Limnocylindria bacterium]